MRSYQMSNIYSEEFRTNVVAVVRSGFGIEKLAKRLSIPPTSVRNWVKNPKYANVLPAGEDLLSKLPEEQTASQGLVLIGDNTAFVNRCCLPSLRIKIGNAEIETPHNTCAEVFRTLVQTLKEANVL